MPRAARYGDQWDIILPKSATVDELRACVLYEYARESEVLVDVVRQHRLSPLSFEHDKGKGIIGFTHLESLEHISAPLAGMVAAMGKRASLASPWSKLAPPLREKMSVAASAAVRLATDDELHATHCWSFYDDTPPAGAIFPLGRDWDDAAGDSTHRSLHFVVDTRATAAEIKAAIANVFDSEFAHCLKGAKGRNASGKEEPGAALRALAVMRLLSAHTPWYAWETAKAAGRHELVPTPSKKSSAPHQRLTLARKTFRTLFPGLFPRESEYAPPLMISDAAYQRRPSRGRRRSP